MTLPDAGQTRSRETRSSRDAWGSQGSPLTTEEVARLSSRIADGDVEARNTLVQANLFLVYRVARGYLKRGLTLDDLIGEGSLGLIRAAEGFDPAFGTRFSTYAVYWIREAILSALINTSTTIRLPGNISKLLTRWRRTEHAIRVAQGRSPGFEEVATALGLDQPTQELMFKAQVVSQLQVESVLSDGQTPWVLRMMAVCSASQDQIEWEEERVSVLRRLERLGGQERSAVLLRFGLAGEAPMSLSEIGGRLGVKVDAVRKLVVAAMQKLSGSRGTRSRAADPAFVSRVG
jgi:RNA polymerase primary sigma factor